MCFIVLICHVTKANVGFLLQFPYDAFVLLINLHIPAFFLAPVHFHLLCMSIRILFSNLFFSPSSNGSTMKATLQFPITASISDED